MKKALAKLSRRAFFGAAAGAAAAGPLAVEAVAKEVGRLSMPPNMGMLAGADNYGWGSAAEACGGLKMTPHEWNLNRLLDLEKQLSGLKRQDPDYRNVSRLDSDLIASRSLSLQARLREQAERNADRAFSNTRSMFQRQIDELKSYL